jgi:tetratricopeptide (TPR) repeat protein
MEDEIEGRRLVAVAEQRSAEGRYEEAIACYEQAMRWAPVALGGYRLVVGELLFELQRYEAAARAFESVVATHPAHAQGWEALGRTLSLLGMPERAAGAFERAIQLAPTWAEALYHAALAHHEAGQRGLAEDRLRRAVALEPRLAEVARDDGLLG